MYHTFLSGALRLLEPTTGTSEWEFKPSGLVGQWVFSPCPPKSNAQTAADGSLEHSQGLVPGGGLRNGEVCQVRCTHGTVCLPHLSDGVESEVTK